MVFLELLLMLLGQIKLAAKLLREPVLHGSDRAILSVSVALQILDACQGRALLERILVSATLIKVSILFRLSVAESRRVVHNTVFVLHRIASHARLLRLVRSAGFL